LDVFYSALGKAKWKSRASDSAAAPDEEAQKDGLDAAEGSDISDWPQTAMPDAGRRQIPPSKILFHC